MKNKSLKQGLVRLLATGAITLGTLGLNGCNNPKNDIYSRIDNSTTITYENKQGIKNAYKTLDIKSSEKAMGIDIKNKIKKLNKIQRKELAIEFNKDIADANIIDPNNVSYKDLIFMYEVGKAVAENAMSGYAY